MHVLISKALLVFCFLSEGTLRSGTFTMGNIQNVSVPVVQ